MRVGMDFRPAMGSTTGIGRYTAALAAALQRDGCEMRLFGVFFAGNRRARRRAPPGTRLVAWRIPIRILRWLRSAGLRPVERVLGGCDLFHHTNFLMAPVSPRTTQVMTFHDLAFLANPLCHMPEAVTALTGVVRQAVDRCGAILVPSEATARDCERHLGLDRDRIFLTPEGVDDAFFELPDVLPERPYLLAVGTLEPRKNYPRLIRAFLRARLDAELRIVGRDGWLFQDVYAAAAGHESIRILGHVPEEKLRRLLAGADAVLYPSLMEGFGLPILEGLAAGKPVLTSDRDPMREVAGGAALLVDPTDEDALCDALVRVCGDTHLREELVRRGPERARQFTWDRCAAATRRAYEAVLA
ncbi:MAG: glycosyltransferase family 4 protein [Planctomycetota bacterium]